MSLGLTIVIDVKYILFASGSVQLIGCIPGNWMSYTVLITSFTSDRVKFWVGGEKKKNENDIGKLTQNMKLIE